MTAHRNLGNLWNYPAFTKEVKQHYELDERRHIRYDDRTGVLFYVIRRSDPPAGSFSLGKFALAEDCMLWMERAKRRDKVIEAYVVLVESYNAPNPPVVVYAATLPEIMPTLDRVEPNVGSEGNTYWWVNDRGECVPIGYTGPIITTPPF